MHTLIRYDRLPVDEYTIEHILPQNAGLSAQWQSKLGLDWERIQKTYLHTLGNLTLTGYNPELSDRPFAEKRDMKGGFRESPLRINQGLGTLQSWTVDAIRQRAEKLAALAARVWPMPKLEPAILHAYSPTPASATYTIADHPHLAAGSLRSVFDEFRKQVLALDPCVSEEFLKLYVAYKAETNFVDVVPQAKRLRLSLNMPFHELTDPKGICKDVSGRGRWGNGDVDVGLSSTSDLPYIMGLVRQAFERQMGSTADS
jgi:predicted transport protein